VILAPSPALTLEGELRGFRSRHDTVPESTKDIQRIIENLVFLDVIRSNNEKLPDASQDCLLGLGDSLRNFATVSLKQGSVVEVMPGQCRLLNVHVGCPWNENA
jgi:hypothetical protein